MGKTKGMAGVKTVETATSSTEVVTGCTVEWQKGRGVVYVHAPDGHTVLRICRLKTIEAGSAGSLKQGQIDITVQPGARVTYPWE